MLYQGTVPRKKEKEIKRKKKNNKRIQKKNK